MAIVLEQLHAAVLVLDQDIAACRYGVRPLECLSDPLIDLAVLDHAPKGADVPSLGALCPHDLIDV